MSPSEQFSDSLGNGSEKRDKLYKELARNILWAQGDYLLSPDQQVRLYGNGVGVTFVRETKEELALRKKNPLPIANVVFKDRKAEVIFNESDYTSFLKEICRPAKIDGHKAASYYIGIGLAYRTLDTLLESVAANHDDDEQREIFTKFLNTITKPPKAEDVHFIVSNIADHDPSIEEHANSVFENLFTSDETRLGRINTLRYAVSTHMHSMVNSDDAWKLWPRDNGDRVSYANDFFDACVLDLIDETKLWRDKIRLAEIFNRRGEFRKIADSIPELSIAGSLPMSSAELNEINSLLEL